MLEDPKIIRMNIANYQAMLKLDLGDDKRAVIQRLLAEAEGVLVLAVDSDPDLRQPV